MSGDLDDDAAAATFNGTAEEEEDDGSNEIVVIEDDFYYLEPVMRVLALLHSLTAFSMLVAYYCLKVNAVESIMSKENIGALKARDKFLILASFKAQKNFLITGLIYCFKYL